MRLNSQVKLEVRPVESADREWMRAFIAEQWGAAKMISISGVFYPETHPGFIAELGGEKIGLLTYHFVGDDCEIDSLAVVRPRRGIGTALMEVAIRAAVEAGCRRVWLITTNDNLNALHFYQKRGFELVAVHRRIIDEWRKVKPEIPPIGFDGIPLRDAIELEMSLTHDARR